MDMAHGNGGIDRRVRNGLPAAVVTNLDPSVTPGHSEAPSVLGVQSHRGSPPTNHGLLERRSVTEKRVAGVGRPGTEDDKALAAGGRSALGRWSKRRGGPRGRERTAELHERGEVQRERGFVATKTPPKIPENAPTGPGLTRDGDRRMGLLNPPLQAHPSTGRFETARQRENDRGVAGRFRAKMRGHVN